MPEFMGTFGVRYKSESHPSGLKVNPDGYVLIHAKDIDHAIRLMQSRYGNAYAFIYPGDAFKEKNTADFYPLGVIDTLGIEGL